MILNIVVGYSLSILNIIFKRKKVLSISLLIFMWILFGFNTYNADYFVNMNKYNDQIGTIIVEPLFKAITTFFRGMGLSYTNFLILFSAIVLINIAVVSYKLVGDSFGFLLGLYFIFPFLYDVTVLRFSVGAIFTLWGVYLLLNKKGKIIIPIILFIFGGLIHFSLFFILIVLLGKFLGNKRTVIFVFCVVIFEFLFLSIFPNLVNLTAGANNTVLRKVNYVLLNTNSFGFSANRTMQVIIFYVLFMISYFFVKRSGNSDKRVEMLFRFNTLILIVLPLIWVNADLYRVQIPLVLFNYAILLKIWKANSKGTYYWSNIIVTIIALLCAFIFEYLYILKNSTWFELVFKAIFQNNSLI